MVFEIGKNYLFESITSNLYVGRLVEVGFSGEVLLEDAAWISETGRLNEFVRTGSAEGMEVELIGTKGLRYASWNPWPHKLFEETI
jgi:hypothetical protein